MDDIWVHTSDIQMTYKYIWVTYASHTNKDGWHKDDMLVHTNDIRMAYKWHLNNVRNIKLYNSFGGLRS